MKIGVKGRVPDGITNKNEDGLKDLYALVWKESEPFRVGALEIRERVASGRKGRLAGKPLGYSRSFNEAREFVYFDLQTDLPGNGVLIQIGRNHETDFDAPSPVNLTLGCRVEARIDWPIALEQLPASSTLFTEARRRVFIPFKRKITDGNEMARHIRHMSALERQDGLALALNVNDGLMRTVQELPLSQECKSKGAVLQVSCGAQIVRKGGTTLCAVSCAPRLSRGLGSETVSLNLMAAYRVLAGMVRAVGEWEGLGEAREAPEWVREENPIFDYL